MWGLLQWLYDRYWDVVNWFGTHLARTLNLLHNFWAWLHDKVTYYYQLARAWAIAKKNEAVAAAWTWFQAAKSTAWGWVENAKSWAWSIVESAKGWAWDIVQGAKQYTSDLVNWLRALLQGAIDWLRGHLEGLIDATKNRIMDWARAAVALVPSVRDLVTAFSGTTLGRLVSLVTTSWGVLSILLSDPLGTIIAYLKNIFVTFLCYSLAYALGTVEETLPPWPVFGTGGEAPPGDGPYPPPAGAGKLGQPVVPLYISGYVFRPGHRAVDFGLVNGQSVFATHGGVIETVAWQPGGLGNYVTVRGSHWWTLYAHLQAAVVAPGQSVDTGQRIAAGDDTGLSTGPHLHFVCKYDGAHVDPVLAIGL